MVLFSRARTRRWGLALALFGASGVLGISTGARADDTPAPPPPVTPPPDDGRTEVHIRAASAIGLEQLTVGEWLEVCRAPCLERLPTDAKYRVRGEGITPSAPFSLVSRGGRAVIEVTPSPDGERVGVGLLVTGGILIALGIGCMAFAVWNIGDSVNSGIALGLGAGGVTAAVGGLAFMTVGGLAFQGRRTKVTQPDRESAANVRRPTWTTGLERVPVAGVAFVAPLFSVSF